MLFVLLVLPIALAALVAPLVAGAADPPTGTMSVASAPLSFVGTAAGTGSAGGEVSCVEGVNCDTFALTVAPGVWTGKSIRVDIGWTIPADDYDLYIHKDSNAGPIVSQSGSGAPSTGESGVINPSKDGVGVYTIHVVYFTTVPADQYRGTATVVNSPSAIYLKGGFRWSPARTVSAPNTVRDGEPSSRCDRQGNYYVAGIRGVPAGVDLWYFNLNPSSTLYDPYMRNGLYRGQPDSFTGDESTELGADGGGDVDIAVGFNTTGVPILAFTSLAVANISSAISTDRGVTWTRNHTGNISGGAPVDDRQWLEFYGANTVYLIYRTFQPAVTQIQRSTDGGLNYGIARTAGQIGQVGCVDVDQRDGTVYLAGSDGKVAVGVSDPFTGEPTTYNVYQVVPGGNANLFLVVKVANDGTAYLCYSDGHDVQLTYSKDKGVTWSPSVRVSDGPETLTSYAPWIETGPAPGSVGIAWYGTSSAVNDNNADWNVFFAQSMNANTQTPTFSQDRVTPYVIHGSNFSLHGLDPTSGNNNRNLIDYFQIAFDPLGAAIIGYADDHNDSDGATYVTRQIGGRTVNGPKLNERPREGSALPRAKKKSRLDPQVIDYGRDVSQGALGVLPVDDPVDILSIYYFSTDDSLAGKCINATFTVSSMTPVNPPRSTWRATFAANAPNALVDPTGTFSYGLIDRADQFFVRATTDATGAVTTTWGTVVRNSDGTSTYTSRGAADGASIDLAKKTITMKVAISKLAPFCTHGPVPIRGSVICGLRGFAADSTSGAAKSDNTRGGTAFAIQ